MDRASFHEKEGLTVNGIAIGCLRYSTEFLKLHKFHTRILLQCPPGNADDLRNIGGNVHAFARLRVISHLPFATRLKAVRVSPSLFRPTCTGYRWP